MAEKNTSDNNIESTISMLLGIFVVIVVGVLLYRYFRNNLGKPAENITQNEELSEQKSTNGSENIATELKPEINVPLPTTYEVQPGDTLWKISMKYFGTGYNWIDISKENGLADSGLLFSGQKLTIPNVQPKIPRSMFSETTKENPIEGNNYTVVKGDTLWKISVRAYQDGYKWSLIAKANNLLNPNIIHPGNVLVIPR